MPADPEQPNCGISGESFDSFWDDATNGWRYRDATAVNAEQAARCCFRSPKCGDLLMYRHAIRAVDASDIHGQSLVTGQSYYYSDHFNYLYHDSGQLFLGKMQSRQRALKR